jgi:uncharacterized membrane protein YbhN (UPF0104 family)
VKGKKVSASWRQKDSLLIRWAGTLLALLLLVILLREENWLDIFEAVKRVSLSKFILALALLLVSRMFVVGRWHVLLRSGGLDISVKSSAMLTFTGLFASNFLPTTIGGDVARLAGAIRLGFEQATCVASLVVDRLIGMLGMVFALPFGLIPFLNDMNSTAAALAFLPRLGRAVREFIRRTLAAFSIWVRKPLALFLSLCCSWGNMAFIFASIFVLITGLGGHVSYWLIAGMWSLTYFVTLIPISINGLGVQEFSLTFLLLSLGGLDHAESLAVAVLIRVLFLLASLPGVIFLPSIISAIDKDKPRL